MSFRKIRMTIALLITVFLLGGCTPQLAASYTEFPLYRTLLDGEEIPCEEGSISIDGKGEGILKIGDRECSFTYDADSVLINNIEAAAAFEQDGVVLTMGDTGLEYYFGTAKDTVKEDGPQSVMQQQWSGNWSGRMYFSSCSGKWEEYNGRSLSLSGVLELNDDNNGRLALYSSVFSEDSPAVISDFVLDETQDHCQEGYIFGYKAEDSAISIKREAKLPSEINNTEFIDPHEYEWYIEEESDEENENPVDVIILSGSCRDDTGAFNYMIELKKEP